MVGFQCGCSGLHCHYRSAVSVAAMVLVVVTVVLRVMVTINGTDVRIDKLTHVGRCGMCVIQPPAGWCPEFALGDIQFTPTAQQLNRLQVCPACICDIVHLPLATSFCPQKRVLDADSFRAAVEAFLRESVASTTPVSLTFEAISGVSGASAKSIRRLRPSISIKRSSKADFCYSCPSI